MQRCWELDPLQRPSAGHMVEMFLSKCEDEEVDGEAYTPVFQDGCRHHLEALQVFSQRKHFCFSMHINSVAICRRIRKDT